MIREAVIARGILPREAVHTPDPARRADLALAHTERYLDSMRTIYGALPEDWRVFTEHKMYEPAFYSTVVQDWGTSYLAAQELGPTTEAVLDTVTTRVEISRKQAADAYGLAEQFETNPRSVWGYVQGLTRLSQRTPWQDQRFALDRAASRLLTTVH